MSEIHAGPVVVKYTDERLFAHIREAISDLIRNEKASFFIPGESLHGSASVLCGPNLPLHFVGAGVNVEADNDTWVMAIALATRDIGQLTVVAENQAAEFLRRSAEDDA